MSCAGPLALFHLRHWRVDFKLGKQGGSSCPKHVSSKSKTHFLSLSYRTGVAEAR